MDLASPAVSGTSVYANGLKHKNIKTFKFVDMQIIIYIYGNHSGVYLRSSASVGRCFSGYEEFLVV